MILDRREHFPGLLCELGLLTVGVEVGTYRGEYARHLLAHWPGVLHCVDPWTHQDDWQDMLNHDQPEMNRTYRTALQVLHPWLMAGRCVVNRGTSLQVAKESGLRDVDFVYLDARHDAAHVTADLIAWAPLVRSGGVLAGHDYLDKVIGPTVYEVKPAVDAWALANGYDVQVTTEDYPTWLVFIR